MVVVLVLMAAGAGAYYIYRIQHRPVLETAYVVPSKLEVVDTPAEVRLVIASLRNGDEVGVLDRTRNWSHIRLADGRTGWVENKDLVDFATYDTGQRVLREMGNVPAQAVGHTNGAVNLRAEPARDGTLLAQLPQSLKVEVFGRRVVDRPPAPDQPSAPIIPEAWYLVRAESRAGWVLGRFVELDIPEGLSPYAQGTNIVAWVALDSADDGGRKIPQYLVADRIGAQEVDFNHIRVFTWWVKKHHYVTAYIESGLNGYFPIRVVHQNGMTYFRLRLIDDAGRKLQKVYGMFSTITRSLGTVEGWESDAMPAQPPPRRRHRR